MHLQTSHKASRTHRGRRVALAALSIGALAFASACSTASSDEASDNGSEGSNGSDTLNIVTSTSIWGDIAQSVADSAEGADVEVTSIVEGNNMDPHHFERSEEHTSELQSRGQLVCRLLLEKTKKMT